MAGWQWFTMGWPGLPRLWRQGAFDALAIAALFAILVNVGIYVEWVVPRAVPWQLRWAVWSTVVIYWVVTQRMERRRERRGFAGGNAEYEARLLQAQQAYLRGQWAEAEQCLRGMLAEVPEDREARLLLVSVLRRSGRPQEALRQLRRLAGMPGQQKWQWEMAKERTLLERDVPGKTEEEDKHPQHATTHAIHNKPMASKAA